jgi:hypothetical protein
VKLFPLAVIVSAPFFAACGGGSYSSTPLPAPQGAAATLGLPARAESAAEAQSDARQPESVSVSSDFFYVGNQGNNSITVYARDAVGNAAPVRVVAGPKTGINTPGQLAQDASGNLYVANGSAGKAAVLVFARGANGDVAPIRVLAGPATGLHTIGAMTVDEITGKIFVEDVQYETNGFLVDVSLLRFAPNAGGNVAPFARSQPGLYPSTELASDSTGYNLIDAHSTNQPSDVGDGVDTLGKQFPNNAAPAPRGGGAIGAFFAGGIADDPASKTYWVSTVNSTTGGHNLYRLAENTSGNGGVEGYPENLSPRPAAVVTGAACGGQLALGAARNLDLACGNAIYVYAATASGHAAPQRVVSGSATGLSGAYGIFEGL